MKTLGLVMIGLGVLGILLSLLGVPGLGRAVLIVGFVLVAGGWVLYRNNKKKELAKRS
jgi:hypothetical protein